MSRTAHSGQGPVDAVEDAALDVAEHPWFERAARGGFVMSGLVHLMIGWIALRIALGDSGEQADQSGALRAFAEAPGGTALLWIGGIGMIALAVWYLFEAWFGFRSTARTSRRAARVATAVGKTAVYAVLAFAALRFATGGGTDSSEQTSSLTASLLGAPVGRWLVILVGLGVIGVGLYHVYKGASRSFEDDLTARGSRTVGPAVVVSGVAGHIAKGIALVAVGFLFGWAGITADPEKATGLDGAMKSIVDLPAGTALLAAVGIGLILFGLYSMLRARYGSI